MNKSLILKFSLALLTGFLVAVVLSRFIPWKKDGPTADRSPEGVLAEIKELKRPLVLINFWASWCAPCKEELPALYNLQKQYADQGLQVVLISIDDAVDIPLAQQYLEENKFDLPSYFKGDQPLTFVTKFFPKWSGAIPANVLLGSEMQILDSWEGESSFEEFEQRIKNQLKGT